MLPLNYYYAHGETGSNNSVNDSCFLKNLYIEKNRFGYAETFTSVCSYFSTLYTHLHIFYKFTISKSCFMF